MSLSGFGFVLPLAALCLWLTVFLFTLVDHFIYRGTYGHFLLGLEAIEREAGSSQAGVEATAAHMRNAKPRYLARYLGNAGSRPVAARLAAESYIGTAGAATLQSRAADFTPRRRRARIVALYALTRAGQPGTLAMLETALASGQEVVAYAALDMLDVDGSEDAAEVLLRALERGVLPASRIATHLENFRVDLTEIYLSRLETEHPKSRYWIAYLLGRSRYNERAAAILERLLSDPAPDVRKIALSALAALEAPRLQAHAELMIDDPVFFVRTQAARILGSFRNASSVRALARKLTDENDSVQLAVKRSLVEVGKITIDYLPSAADLSDPAALATIAQITNTIRAAERPGVALLHIAMPIQGSHV